jgi:hypothetical protein
MHYVLTAVLEQSYPRNRPIAKPYPFFNPAPKLPDIVLGCPAGAPIAPS